MDILKLFNFEDQTHASGAKWSHLNFFFCFLNFRNNAGRTPETIQRRQGTLEVWPHYINQVYYITPKQLPKVPSVSPTTVHNNTRLRLALLCSKQRFIGCQQGTGVKVDILWKCAHCKEVYIANWAVEIKGSRLMNWEIKHGCVGLHLITALMNTNDYQHWIKYLPWNAQQQKQFSSESIQSAQVHQACSRLRRRILRTNQSIAQPPVYIPQLWAIQNKDCWNS